MENILLFLNKLIREEHGNKVTIDSMYVDAEVDSFGTTVIFLELNEKYPGKFNNEWFKSIESWDQLTVKSIIERVTNENI